MSKPKQERGPRPPSSETDRTPFYAKVARKKRARRLTDTRWLPKGGS
jgi:hypothetical protein